ncbi:hypothetical protein ATANTOWER_012567 [Ataeniobius toweri]|uniref:Uncharacterized protein n=1 Tax=Ataeniobius toweri TaxID=208326 RepID=A0ABU7C9F1_9TELE|nr:hypothetical protein [Ataeniobius toweri]
MKQVDKSMKRWCSALETGGMKVTSKSKPQSSCNLQPWLKVSALGTASQTLLTLQLLPSHEASEKLTRLHIILPCQNSSSSPFGVSSPGSSSIIHY